VSGITVSMDPDSSGIQVRLLDRDRDVAVSAKGASEVFRQQVSVNSPCP
jgi:hypothetical protein